MNWQLLGPLLISTSVAVLGWFVGHLLSARRDVVSKRREQRIGYLIEAYRRLESCAHRGDALDVPMFESSVADIQLFGSRRQVELVQEVLTEYAKGGDASIESLLQDLRADLRQELKLEPVASKTLHARITKTKVRGR